MCLLWWTVLLLAAVLREGASGASSHSYRYFYTAVSEPDQGLPRFLAVGYVDGQLMAHYDSDTRRFAPRAPWMAKAGEEDPQYWERETQKFQGWEEVFREGLETTMESYNHSAGLHTLQFTYGCELSEGGAKKGYWQYGYDGRDFIALDKENLTWTAADAAAGITKRKWEEEPALAQEDKDYLEEECIEWLRKYLRYGNETLLRTEPPVVTVTCKDSQDGLETLLCRAHGFYPKEINITWRRDGEARPGDTFRGVLSPNADSTYYTWLSIEVDPQERSRFRCHVEHDGLGEPLDVAVEEAGPAWLLAVGVVLAVTLVVAAVVAGVVFYVT